jgi:hypothetical protein
VEVCGPYSDTITAPEPSITFKFASGPPSYDGTAWSWTTGPQNGALQPQYWCGSHAVYLANADHPENLPQDQVVGANSCTPGTPVAGDAALYVRIGGHGHVYVG